MCISPLTPEDKACWKGGAMVTKRVVGPALQPSGAGRAGGVVRGQRCRDGCEVREPPSSRRPIQRPGATPVSIIGVAV